MQKLILVVITLISVSATANSFEKYFENVKGNWTFISDRGMTINHDGSIEESGKTTVLLVNVVQHGGQWRITEDRCTTVEGMGNLCGLSLAEFSQDRSGIYWNPVNGEKIYVNVIKSTSSKFSYSLVNNGISYLVVEQFGENGIWLQSQTYVYPDGRIAVVTRAFKRAER